MRCFCQGAHRRQTACKCTRHEITQHPLHTKMTCPKAPSSYVNAPKQVRRHQERTSGEGQRETAIFDKQTRACMQQCTQETIMCTQSLKECTLAGNTQERHVNVTVRQTCAHCDMLRSDIAITGSLSAVSVELAEALEPPDSALERSQCRKPCGTSRSIGPVWHTSCIHKHN